MRLASRLLLAARGASHVDEQHRPVESEPAWLERYRSAGKT
jgi:hypothetical protein